MSGKRPVEESSTTSGVPIAPSLGVTAEGAGVAKHVQLLDRRTLFIALLSGGIAVVATGVAWVLVRLIALITNFAFFGHLSVAPASPGENTLGLFVILVPVIGAFFVGLMARYGSKAIRGHGIPEAMEQILLNESKIPARLTFLKPVSAAIAIGTGGPFGAEGPIIATGGAFGSLVGQLLHTKPNERKVLLAAGAAAGMTAIFGSPVSAVLLAIELLLFEFKPRSFVPVALAVAVTMAVRPLLFGTAPMFAMGNLPEASAGDLLIYAAEGVVLGVFSVFISKSVYLVEDAFEKLPIHWMWWPMIGAVAVGVVGYFSPGTLGVGYTNIDRILSGEFVGSALFLFCLLKFTSWAIALGSGTSGGTLAPLFTIGGGIGVLFGSGFSRLTGTGVDLRVAAVVGMASVFAGASRALFTSVVFAFETTRQANGLTPLLVGCTVAYVVSAFMMKHTIMTEKLARRGHHVPVEYSAVGEG
jgi:CIC family chloride channel protein